MATAATGWGCTADVIVVAETNTTATIRVICYWKNQGWRYNMNYVSAWVYCNGSAVQVKSSGWIDTTGDNQAAYELGRHDFVVNKTTGVQSIPFCAKITSDSSYASGTRWSGDTYINVAALPSHTVSYNANGGSGAPGNQTKWYGYILTLSSTRPTRTGYSFQGWATSSGGSVVYHPGGQYGSDSNVTLYAVWKANTYTVTYNANGGTGAPANQTKTYGTTLKLSTTKPTKTNYNFLGWSTSADGSVVYAAGANYTNNSAVTLYAVWELAYVKPRINNFAVQRCTSDGVYNEEGTYAKVTFEWSTDKDVSEIKIEWQIQNGDTWLNTNITASGTSGSVSEIVGDGEIDIETTYMFKSSVSDSGGTTPSSQLTLGTIKFPIDVKKGGRGVAIGKVAETDELFDVDLDAKFRGDVKAERVNSYQFGVSGGAKWYYIGDFVFDYQGQYAIIDCYLGDGQNGGHTQNTHMKIILKQGAPNSTYPVGVTTNFTQNYADESRIRVKIAHSATMECKLYIYLGFSWNDLTCIVNGSYKTFTPILTTSTEEPVTDKESSYYYNGGYTLYDNTSGTTGSITLSQSAAAFNRLEIHYYLSTGTDGRIYSSRKIPVNGNAELGVNRSLENNSSQIVSELINVSGTTITVKYGSYVTFTGGALAGSGSAVLHITRVVGYR